MKAVGFVGSRSAFVAVVAWLIATALTGGIPSWTFFLAIFGLLWVAWVLVALRRRWSHQLIR